MEKAPTTPRGAFAPTTPPAQSGGCAGWDDFCECCAGDPDPTSSWGYAHDWRHRSDDDEPGDHGFDDCDAVDFAQVEVPQVDVVAMAEMKKAHKKAEKKPKDHTKDYQTAEVKN